MRKQKTMRLVAELQEMLAKPSESALIEMIIVAEMRASAAIRRACGESAGPLVPANIHCHLADLKETTGEQGEAWSKRVDALLRKAIEQGADPASVKLVWALATPTILRPEKVAFI